MMKKPYLLFYHTVYCRYLLPLEKIFSEEPNEKMKKGRDRNGNDRK